MTAADHERPEQPTVVLGVEDGGLDPVRGEAYRRTSCGYDGLAVCTLAAARLRKRNGTQAPRRDRQAVQPPIPALFRFPSARSGRLLAVTFERPN